MVTHRSATNAPGVVAERLQALVDGLAARRRFGHAIVGVERRDGSFRWRGAAGIANADGTPMTPETPFFIASVTKLYIATLVLQLHEEEKVDLNAPVSTYLGAERVQGLLRIGEVDHTPDVTVFHLISHTSGLNDYLEGKPMVGGVCITRSQMARIFPGDSTTSWQSPARGFAITSRRRIRTPNAARVGIRTPGSSC